MHVSRKLYFGTTSVCLEMGIPDKFIASIDGLRHAMRNSTNEVAENIQYQLSQQEYQHLQRMAIHLQENSKLRTNISEFDFNILQKEEGRLFEKKMKYIEEDESSFRGSKFMIGDRVYAKSKNNKFFTAGAVLFASPVSQECDILFDINANPIDGYMNAEDEWDDEDEPVKTTTEQESDVSNVVNIVDDPETRHEMLLCGLKYLAEEIKRSQWYVDENGVPTKRTTAKVALTKVVAR
jgi:hypothetical protein